MALLARAKIPTPLCRIPGDLTSKVKMLKPDEQIRFIGTKKVGLNTYYYTNDNLFVIGKEVQILRDEDFFFNNYKSKFLMRDNYSTAGGTGLTAVMSNESENTGIYADLMDNNFTAADVADGNNASAYSEGVSTVTSANNPKPNYTMAVLGTALTVGGGIIPNTSGNKEVSNLVNGLIKNSFGQSVGNSSDMPVGSRTNDAASKASIASTGKRDPNTELIVNFAASYLKKWVNDKLSYVVGFGTSSALTQILSAFGLDFRSLLTSGMSNIFGNMGGIFGDIFNRAFGLRGISKNGYHPYHTVDEALLKYFKYKGCDGRMIVKNYAGLRWEQDESYATPILSPSKDEKEVQIWKDIYNADYDEVSNVRYSGTIGDTLKKVKDEFDLDLDRDVTFKKFNRFRAVTPNNVLTGTKGYIFFTRPDLNLLFPDPNSLTDSEGTTNTSNANMNSMNMVNDLTDASSQNGTSLDVTRARMSALASNLRKSHSTLAAYLMGDSAGANHQFNPILGHLCTGIDVADEVLETTEFAETYTGWKYVYGTSMIKSKTAGTMNVMFNDDNKLSLYKIMKIWTEYIQAVYRGETRPKKTYLDRHVLDYAISIYYFLTDNTGTNILFWTKYTGCFPTSVPASNFADSISTPIRNPSYSVTFAYSRKDDCNPIHLAEFNNLSDTGSGTPEFMPMYNAETIRSGRSFVGAPFIDTNDGGYTYHLRFRKS